MICKINNNSYHESTSAFSRCFFPKKTRTLMPLRGQPFLYNRQFTKYRRKSWYIVIVSPQNTKIVFVENFRLFEGYTYLRPVISSFQPTFYDQWFEMFCTILKILDTILTQKVGFSRLSAWSPIQPLKASKYCKTVVV